MTNVCMNNKDGQSKDFIINENLKITPDVLISLMKNPEWHLWLKQHGIGVTYYIEVDSDE